MTSPMVAPVSSPMARDSARARRSVWTDKPQGNEQSKTISRKRGLVSPDLCLPVDAPQKQENSCNWSVPPLEGGVRQVLEQTPQRNKKRYVLTGKNTGCPGPTTQIRDTNKQSKMCYACREGGCVSKSGCVLALPGAGAGVPQPKERHNVVLTSRQSFRRNNVVVPPSTNGTPPLFLPGS